MSKTILVCENIWKSFGSTEVLKNINFEVQEGEIFFLLGPSGCGKTTLLRILSGFCEPDKGKIILDGKDITDLSANKRNIGMVFQNYALWPHMNVWENVAYGLKVRKASGKNIQESVEKILNITQLLSHKDKFPNQLSGGQQQRVALSRALVTEPKILLLDEPLSNLDAKLRDQMREEIKKIQKAIGITMIYVTHDQKEALTLGNRIAVIDNGEIIQTGTPFNLYFEPKNRFVASFIGTMNFLKAKVTDVKNDSIELDTSEGKMLSSKKEGVKKGDEIEIGFRPEIPVIKEGNVNNITGKISEIEYGGEIVKLKINTTKNNSFIVNILAGKEKGLKRADTITFSISSSDIVIFKK